MDMLKKIGIVVIPAIIIVSLGLLFFSGVLQIPSIQNSEVSPECLKYNLDGRLVFEILSTQMVSSGLEKDPTLISKYNVSLAGGIPDFFENFFKSYNDSKVNDLLIDYKVCLSDAETYKPTMNYPAYPQINYSIMSQSEIDSLMQQYNSQVDVYNKQQSTYSEKLQSCTEIMNNIYYRIYLDMRPRYENVTVMCPSSFDSFKNDGRISIFYMEGILSQSGLVTNPLFFSQNQTQIQDTIFNLVFAPYNITKVNDLYIDYKVCYQSAQQSEPTPINYTTASQDQINQYNTQQSDYETKLSDCNSISQNMIYRIYLDMKTRYVS